MLSSIYTEESKIDAVSLDTMHRFRSIPRKLIKEEARGIPYVERN